VSPVHPPRHSRNDTGEAVDRYLAVVNEGERGAAAPPCRRTMGGQWRTCHRDVDEHGPGEIAAAIAEAQAANGSRGLAVSPANRSQMHHQVAWFQWHLKAKNNGAHVLATATIRRLRRA
jgi:hypothetical protein